MSDPTPDEAADHLAQIRQVIARSRAERARSGDIYLVWGVVIVLADASTLAGLVWDQPGWLAYPLLVPVAVIYAAVSAVRRAKSWSSFGSRVEARTWQVVTLAMLGVWLGGFGSGLLDFRAIIPVVCAVLGVATGTSGALFDSRMLTAASVVMVAVGAVSWFVSDVVQHLLFIGAMLAGYVVPAVVMLRGEARRDG